MTNSADSDQLTFTEANWSGSTLFDKTGHVVFSKRRVNLKDIPATNNHFRVGKLCTTHMYTETAIYVIVMNVYHLMW